MKEFECKCLQCKRSPHSGIQSLASVEPLPASVCPRKLTISPVRTPGERREERRDRAALLTDRGKEGAKTWKQIREAVVVYQERVTGQSGKLK